MFITLRNASTSYRLAGEYGVSERVHSPAGNLRIAPTIAVQSAELVRAAAAAHYDRGNLKTQIEFTTTRVFASPAAAQLWALDYDGAFPRTGDVWLDALATDGTTLTRRVLAGAIVEPPQRECYGATVKLAYVIRGGAITAWTGPIT